VESRDDELRINQRLFDDLMWRPDEALRTSVRIRTGRARPPALGSVPTRYGKARNLEGMTPTNSPAGVFRIRSGAIVARQSISYTAAGAPNQVASASASPASVPSPTHAT
jgi:hypothetical protein